MEDERRPRYERLLTEDGKYYYYYDNLTQTSSWEPPADFVAARGEGAGWERQTEGDPEDGAMMMIQQAEGGYRGEQSPSSSVASAPGKCILFGEHSVVYGYPAVAAALSDLRIFVHVALHTEGSFVEAVLSDLPSEGSKGGPVSARVTFEDIRGALVACVAPGSEGHRRCCR